MRQQDVCEGAGIHARTPRLFGWLTLLNAWLSAPVWWARHVRVPRVETSFSASGRRYRVRRLGVEDSAALAMFFAERLPAADHRFVPHPVDEHWLRGILGRRTLIAVGVFGNESDLEAPTAAGGLIGYGLVTPIAWGWAQTTYVVAPDYRGCGLGVFLLRCLLEIIFEIRHRLFSTILARNAPSVAVAEAAGIRLRPLLGDLLLATCDRPPGVTLEDSH